MRGSKIVALLALCVLSSCRKPEPPRASGPIAQRGYLWQRNWTPAVESAFAEAQRRFAGVVVLGGEIVREGATPKLIKSSVRWDAIARSDKPITLGLRVAPDAADAPGVEFIATTATSLVAEARASGARVAEFQIDFDCPQKKLALYRSWLAKARAALHPVPVSITALPAWLDEREFPALVGDVDGYVLQVHSVPAHSGDGEAVLCDPASARKWVEKAARFGRPFSVSLPTYRCLAGYDPTAKLLGVAMDSVQPAWPAGTMVLEFGANADEIARLVRQWTESRPATLQSLIWYRAPTGADQRNWRWPTLAAVMEGREPMHQIEITRAGENPVDVGLLNRGEAEETTARAVEVRAHASVVASDALPGWTATQDGARVQFAPDPAHRLRLSPGERRDIGWIRYDRTTEAQVNFVEPATTR